MKAKHHVLLYTFLSLALVVAVFAAFDQGIRAQQNAQALQSVQNQHMLQTQELLQSIVLKLAKIPVADDVRTRVELLTAASRQAEGAMGSLSALSMSRGEADGTMRFLNQLSEYTLMLSLLAASGRETDADAAQKLSELESRCRLLIGRLATAQPEALLWEENADGDNGMDYPTMIYDGAFSDARHRGEPRALGTKQVTQEEAVEIARSFVGEERVRDAQPGVPFGGVLESWGVTLTLQDGTVLSADVTKQGGQLLWIVPEHAGFEPKLTLEECSASARAFLIQRGYDAMEPSHYQVYDGLAVISFVSVQDGVLLYPDLIKVQMRMDTGELVGLESNNYLMNHQPRADLAPAIAEAEARTRVSPRLQVTGMRLCLIPWRDGERLCWEAAGRYQGEEYRVYIDARTGEEVQVLLMVDSTDGRLAA